MGYIEKKGFNERAPHGEVVFDGTQIEAISGMPRPDFTTVVEMPEINFYFGIKRARAGMHTDMLLSLCRTMEKMKPHTLKNIFIEGRLLTLDQWDTLEQSKPYRFFYNRRFGRTAKAAHESGVLDLVLPPGTDITEADVASLGSIELTVKSLSDTVLPFKTGFLPMSELLEQFHIGGNPNVLLPVIGAVNKFVIGTSTLAPGYLRFAKTAIEEGMRTIDSLKSVDLSSVPGAIFKQREALQQL